MPLSFAELQARTMPSRSRSEMSPRLATAFGLLATGIAAGLIWLAFQLKNPMFAAARTPVHWGGLGLAALMAAIAFRLWWRARAWPLLVAVVSSLAAMLFLASVAGQLRTARERVLATAPADLALIGRHVMAGYRDPTEIRLLIARGAVGGVFVTARNARHLTVAALTAEIAGFQALAKQHGHSPLIIATDQEGGFVSRLSPPLASPPLLSAVIAAKTGVGERRAAVTEAAAMAARDLKRVGVTLNFAPLADLDFGIRNPADKMSRIGERASGRSPELVAEVAGAYCRAASEAGVRCTLKHFPGLGRVAADTHVEGAVLGEPVPTLAAEDWVPFRRVLAETDAALMVGHVRLVAADAGEPASLSKAVIGDIVRGQWGFDGLIVTDDLNMGAVFDLPGGIGAGAVKSLDAGADLLLVSWDPDQVYPMLDALLQAHAAGRLDAANLARSQARLRRLAGSGASQ